MAIKHLWLTNYRAFGVDPTRVPRKGDLRQINLFVGPNGSGKTALMNSIKAAMGRNPENSQLILEPGLDDVQAKCADHHEHGSAWKVAVAFAFADGTPSGTLYASRDANSSAVISRKYVRSDGHDSDAIDLVYDRLFTFGWPRQILRLDSKAFRTQPILNPEAYVDHWDQIKADALHHLGAKLCNPSLIASPRACPKCDGVDGAREGGKKCFHCDQVYPKKRPRPVGLCFLDRNDRPLTQGSDGDAHFLQLIMEVRKHAWSTTFLIEEPDVYLHPGMQKEFMKYVKSVSLGSPFHQFLITTHSPYMLDWTSTLARKESRSVRVYRLQYEPNRGACVNAVTPTKNWDLLERLGHQPSDVLHPNGNIWVEGPSDIHFIAVWLDLWRKENNKLPIRWGLDCGVLTYGGSNIKYLTAKRSALKGAVAREVTELCIALRSVSKGVVVIIDQDPGERKGSRRNKLNARKRIEHAGGTVWFSRDRNVRTIESYANPSLLKRAKNIARSSGKTSGSKVAVARAYEVLARRRGAVGLAINARTDLKKWLAAISDTIDGWAKPVVVPETPSDV